MKCVQAVVMACALAFVAAGPTSAAQRPSGTALLKQALNREFDLAGKRTPGTYYFRMETRFVQFALDGKRVGTQTLRVWLRCEPEGDAYRYTCRRFTLQKDDEPQRAIPALSGWSYLFSLTASGTAKFEGLVDEAGAPLPPGDAYMVYNTFIDFHGVCDVFGTPTAAGGGIQDLKAIGLRIVHAAANTRPPVNLGTNVKEGSYFQNGEATLALKGVSLVDQAPCAVVGFDSGECSLHMVIEPMPNMKVTTDGASHYWGDLYVDLETNWPRKAVLREIVVTQTTLPGPANVVHAVHERETEIRMVNQEEFAED